MVARNGALLACLAAMVGCGADAESVARVRAANDFHCNQDKVSVESVGGTSYRAKGCGESEIYDCTGSAVGRGVMGNSETTEYVCVPERRRHGDDED